MQTVATNLDGTSGSGTVDFTCPDVSPNSAIYFYQYTQAGAPTAWTTRFTIAAADGSSVRLLTMRLERANRNTDAEDARADQADRVDERYRLGNWTAGR